jgi:hypothetical protein
MRSLQLSASDLGLGVPVWLMEVWVAETMGHLESGAAMDCPALLVPSAREMKGRRRSWVGYVTFVPLPQRV